MRYNIHMTAKNQTEKIEAAEQKLKNPHKKGWFWLVFSCSIILVAVMAFVGNLIRFEVSYVAFEIEGQSMYPTLNNGGEKDLVYANKYKAIRPQHMVVIDCRAIDYVNVEYIVKRIIAVGGDTVDIVEKDGSYVVKRNGKILKKTDALVSKYKELSAYKLLHGLDENKPLTLANDEVFVMGDNHAHSTDSAKWGPFKKKDVVGVVDFITKYNKTSAERRLEKFKYAFIFK